MTTKSKIEQTKANITTIMLQDQKEWFQSMKANIAEVNKSVLDFGSLKTPPDFSSIGNQFKSLEQIAYLNFQFLAAQPMTTWSWSNH